MSKNVTIKLAEPIMGHKGAISEIVLRPPVWRDVMGLGSPYTIHADAEGRPFLVYDEAVIGKYAELLLADQSQLLLLEDVGLAETMQVREAIVDFFLAAAAGGGGSTTSPKTSSSTSNGSPTP